MSILIQKCFQLRKFLILFSILLLSFSAFSIELLPFESSWKYNDSGTNLGTTWRDVGYNDASWSSGNGQLGFGDADENTTLNNVSQATFYFRKQFTIEELSGISAIDIKLIRDDGAVVYINGTEVWRTNMPAGSINSSTLATIAADPENGIYTTTIGVDAFVEGVNTIAVEVHQNATNSSDLSFDCELSINNAAAGPNFLPKNSTWKYNASGSNLGTTWRGTGYNDASWSSGPAVLGFGDPVSTTITNHGGYNYYFRKSFEINDADAFYDYTLELLRDDGAVVYVNGTEVWRSNMPTGTINYNTAASATTDGAAETTYNTLKYQQ
jgi:hypothetical protein